MANWKRVKTGGSIAEDRRSRVWADKGMHGMGVWEMRTRWAVKRIFLGAEKMEMPLTEMQKNAGPHKMRLEQCG